MLPEGQGEEREVLFFSVYGDTRLGCWQLLWGPLQGAGRLLDPKRWGQSTGRALVPLSWADSACFCPEPQGTHAFISGPTGLASSPAPRAQVQVQGLGFGRNRDKGGREDGGGGLTPGGTE